MDRPTPRPATEVPADRLLELVHGLRAELLLREESPSGAWVEETAERLRRGETPGWSLPSAPAGGLAFYNRRGREAFGHVHVESGAAGGARSSALATALLDSLPADVASIDLGFTGLTTEEEGELLGELGRRPGSTVVHREAMERPIGPDDAAPLGPLPPGVRHAPVRDITLDALADLDVRAFRGSEDELLIGGTVADYRRVLETLVDGGMGRFLDEASTTLLETEPLRLVGALLTAEQSPRRAVYLDFIVDPERHGRGHGRYLLQWGFRALWALGYERVRLWVTVSNATALHLYREVGFRRTATAVIYRWSRAGAGPQPQASR